VDEVGRTNGDFDRERKANELEIRSRVPVFVLRSTPVDLPFERPRLLWRVFMSPVRLVAVLGHLYGACLYPFALTKMRAEGPPTERVISREVPK
jgi:hypothetical protein